jgi:hypothetical protein
MPAKKPIPQLLKDYPAPWTVNFAPEIHRAAVIYKEPYRSATGNVVTGEAAFDREPNSVLDSVTAANMRDVLEMFTGGEGEQTMPTEFILELVEIINSHAKKE